MSAADVRVDDADAHRPGAARLLALWTFPAVVALCQLSLAGAFPREFDGAWRTVAFHLGDWWFWAAATPAVLQVARRVPLGRGHGVVVPTAMPTAVAVHLATWFTITLLHRVLLVAMMTTFWPTRTMDMSPWAWVLHGPATRLVMDLVTYAAIVAAGAALVQARAAASSAAAASALRADLADARLDALRWRLQPHFLFNALNGVAMLVRAGRTKEAVTTLAELAHLLRTILATEAREVPLRAELALVRRYLGVEQVRFAGRLASEVVASDEALDAVVPFLLLQPLAENAVLHGVAARGGNGLVRIEARRSGDALRVEVAGPVTLDASHTGVGSAPEPPRAEADGTGSGLATTRRRLVEHYGTRHRLELVPDGAGGMLVRLELPYRVAARAGAREQAHA